MKITGKQFLIIGSFLSGLGVALGAVGAHALKEVLLANNRTNTFEAAVRYHLFHGLALILVGILCYVLKEIDFTLSGLLLLVGVTLFSLSLYLLCLTQMSWVAFATPIGGVLMISGWVLLTIKLMKAPK